MADTVTYPRMTGVTRRELRETIGTALGDLIVITATQDSETPTTFIDESTLVHEPRYYTGRQAYFTLGTIENQELVRHVQSSSQESRSITFSTALPANVQTGDQAHLVNWRGVGFTISDYHNAINAAIRDMHESHYEMPASFEVNESYDAETNTITLPDNFVSVESLEYYDEYTGWTEIYPSEGAPQHGWTVDRFQNAIQLSPGLINRLGDWTLRVRGLADPAPLNDDGDVTYLPHEWLVAEVQARLLEMSLARNPGIGERSRLFVQLRERANNIRPLGFSRPGPFSARIR